MSSTFGTILDAVSDELSQFNFKTVAKGWFFDRTKALPACLVVPQAKEREAYSHFADVAHYRVALVMEFGERDSSQLLAETLETAEQIQTHFHHRLFASLSGHIDTEARITRLSESGGKSRVDYAAPAVELTLAVIEEI